MKIMLAGVAVAAVALSACGDDTSDALSAFCDSQESVIEQLNALQELDPTTNTIDEYREALDDLGTSVDEAREARADLVAQDVDNVQNAWQSLVDEVSSIDVPISDAGDAVQEAVDAQIDGLTELYESAYASSSCSE